MNSSQWLQCNDDHEKWYILVIDRQLGHKMCLPLLPALTRLVIGLNSNVVEIMETMEN